MLTASATLVIGAPAASAAGRISSSSDLSYFASSSEDTTATQHPNWMSWLNPNLSLRDVTLPGTHDSGTYAHFDTLIPTDLYTDQTMSILSQLQSGIRFFDIRVLCVWNVAGTYDFPIIHGPVSSDDIDLYDVASFFHSYFLSHANESAVVQISHAGHNGDSICENAGSVDMPHQFNKQDGTPTTGLDGFGALFKDQFAKIQSAFGNVFYRDPSLGVCDSLPDAPTVGQAKAHVVMEMGFNGEGCSYNALQDPGGTYYDDPAGQSGSVYADYSSASACNDLLAQKYKNYVLQNVTRIATNPTLGGSLVGTWTQASAGLSNGCIGYSYKSAQIVNALFLAALLNAPFGNGVNLGFVGMDYPGAALISALIMMNLHHATSAQAYMASNDFQQGAQDLFHGYHNGTSTGGAPERALEQQQFFEAAQPTAIWHSLVAFSSNTVGNAVWEANNGVNFYGVTNGFDFFIWQTNTGNIPKGADFDNNQAGLHSRVEQLVDANIDDPHIAEDIFLALQSAETTADCSVFVQFGGDGDSSLWSVETWGVFYAAQPRGDLFTYVMCAEKSTGLGGGISDPVPVSGTPFPVAPPPPTTPPATSSSSGPVLANTNASVDERYPLLIAALIIVIGAVLVGVAGPARTRAHTGRRHG
jgi:hypothetical protein